jgi:protein TonB
MFEATLLERFRRTRRRRNVAALALAVAAHVAGVTAVMLARLWAVEPLDEPPILVTLWLPPEAPPPPPAPPPPKRGAPVLRRDRPQPAETRPPEVTQPVVVPTAVPQPAAAEAGDTGGTDDGVEGGLPGGVAGGVVGGEIGGALGGVPGGLPGMPMRAGLGGIREPKRLKYVRPAYTEAARRKRTQGAVVLDVVIEKDGSVGAVKVLMPLGEGLTESAIAAVKQWRYEVSEKDGRPIAVMMLVTIQFSLL